MVYVRVLILIFLCSSCENINRQKNQIDVKHEEWEEKPIKELPLVKKPTIVVKKEPTISILRPKAEKKSPGENSMNEFCRELDQKFYQYGWRRPGCGLYKWKFVRRSFLGRPIAWVHYGEPEHLKANTTIVLCGVHGDEITPVKFCFDLMSYLDKRPKLTEGNRIIVAPLVTPDSFFKKYPTRTNARGVDVNRNFPTRDWHAKAHKMWKHRYRSSKRKYPGKRPMSEQETYFQVNLIKRYKPNKIISVHAPLTIIDYDGPSAHKDEEAHSLLMQMSKSAKGYKVKNYPYFPGSLGNWAGNMNNIPTYTLELPSSDNRESKKFWKLFERAMGYAITHRL